MKWLNVGVKARGAFWGWVITSVHVTSGLMVFNPFVASGQITVANIKKGGNWVILDTLERVSESLVDV